MKEKWPILASGAVLGIIVVILGANILALCGCNCLGLDLRGQFFNGVWNGLGIGAGASLGLGILNLCLGFIDKLLGNPASQQSSTPKERP